MKRDFISSMKRCRNVTERAKSEPPFLTKVLQVILRLFAPLM